MGDSATSTTGSILVKTGWMLLGSGHNPVDYYTATSLYYKGEEEEPCYDYAEFGLVAIHIIRKTVSFPYFFFSTFEHVNNYPGSFVYANTEVDPILWTGFGHS